MKFDKEKFKAKAKKYAPLAQGAISMILAGVAAYYVRENNGLKSSIDTLLAEDENVWPVIEIPPGMFERIKDGETVKYREVWVQDGNELDVYAQITVRDEFADSANETYEESQKLRKKSESN